MSRAERLLDLIQLLRRHRRPVTGEALATELGVSLRTLYRDVATLQAQGARIDGAPGLGYLLHEGFVLPPLMFSSDEVEALALGSRWVAERGDTRLAAAARDALAKIAAVLPAPLRAELDASALLVGPGAPIAAGDAEVAEIRGAIRGERTMRIVYRDGDGRDTERIVWPIAIGFFDRVRLMVAWFELRGALCHFRTDRIAALEVLDARAPRPRQALLREWRAQQGLPEPDARC